MRSLWYNHLYFTENAFFIIILRQFAGILNIYGYEFHGATALFVVQMNNGLRPVKSAHKTGGYMHHIGIDILRLDRLRPLDGQWDDPFFRRTFTVSEQQHCQAQSQPLMAYAGMFAAKEAVFKALALPPDRVRLQHIEISHGENGEPLVTPLPPLDGMAAERGITHIALSISYEADMAAAIAIAE